MEQPTPVTKPEGGFVFIRVRQVCRAWVAYQHRVIHLVDLWVWFAAHEVRARRCLVKAGQPVRYRVEELTHIVGGGHRMPASLRRLAQAGLLAWDEHTLTFPDEEARMGDSEALTRMLARITNSQRQIPVPRRVLRYLAGGCPKVLVATILGHFLRCLYYRKGACHPAGRCKATWIAQVFGVSLRQVKQNRQRLEAIGLLQRRATVQWVLNRYGQGMCFNLQWQEPRFDAPPRAEQPMSAQPAAGVTARREADTNELLRPVSVPSSRAEMPPLPPRRAVPGFAAVSPKPLARPPLPPTTAAPDRDAPAAQESSASNRAPASLTALVQRAQAARRAGQTLDEQLLMQEPTDTAPAPAPKAECQARASAGPEDAQADGHQKRAPFSLPSVGQILGFTRRVFAAPRREEPLAQPQVAPDLSVVQKANTGELLPSAPPATPAAEPPQQARPTAPAAATLSPTPLARSPRATRTSATANAARVDRAAHESPVTTFPAGHLTALVLRVQADLRAGQQLDENSLCLAPTDAVFEPARREELPSHAVSAPVSQQTKIPPVPAPPPVTHLAEGEKSRAEIPVHAESKPQAEAQKSGPDSLSTPPIAACGATVFRTPQPDPHPLRIAPLLPPQHPPIAPPDSHLELSTIEKDQQPAALGSAGVVLTLTPHAQTGVRADKLVKGKDERRSASTHAAADHALRREVSSAPVDARNLVQTSPDRPMQTPLPAPTLRHILPHDLRDTGRLLQLYAQAVTAGLSGPAEADRLAFVALAQHVLAYRPNNPGGLFTQLLRKRLFHYATQDEEDRALQRLKRHLHGGTPPILQPVVETALRRTG